MMNDVLFRGKGLARKTVKNQNFKKCLKKHIRIIQFFQKILKKVSSVRGISRDAKTGEMMLSTSPKLYPWRNKIIFHLPLTHVETQFWEIPDASFAKGEWLEMSSLRRDLSVEGQI